jgi:hypothetical protein
MSDWVAEPKPEHCTCTNKRHVASAASNYKVVCMREVEPGTDMCIACIHVCLP